MLDVLLNSYLFHPEMVNHEIETSKSSDPNKLDVLTGMNLLQIACQRNERQMLYVLLCNKKFKAASVNRVL